MINLLPSAIEPPCSQIVLHRFPPRKIARQHPRPHSRNTRLLSIARWTRSSAGILKWVVGDRTLATFRLLWLMIQGWCCFLSITDGYLVYPCLIDDCDHLVSKTAMTRVEGVNSRLRHRLARLHRQTFCYSQYMVDAQSVDSSVALLLEVSTSTYLEINHSPFVQRPFCYWRSIVSRAFLLLRHPLNQFYIGYCLAFSWGWKQAVSGVGRLPTPRWISWIK